MKNIFLAFVCFLSFSNFSLCEENTVMFDRICDVKNGYCTGLTDEHLNQLVAEDGNMAAITELMTSKVSSSESKIGASFSALCLCSELSERCHLCLLSSVTSKHSESYYLSNTSSNKKYVPTICSSSGLCVNDKIIISVSGCSVTNPGSCGTSTPPAQFP